MEAGRRKYFLRIAPHFLLILAAFVPLFFLTSGFFRGSLGPNPVERITHETGHWTLRLLLATLAVTPLRRLTGAAWIARLRRTLGLLAFFYGTLHLFTYLWLDQFFDWRAIARDVARRRFITAGMVSFAAMAPLAVTSTRGWIVRLGGKRWQRLHRLVYVSAAAGVMHFWWLVKSDIREPALYASLFALLMLARLKNGDRHH